jgi:hypothetical protein
MSKKQVVVDVTADGFTVNINGMTGTGCEAISKAFASAGDVVDHKKKPEYFRNAKATVNVSNTR